MFNYHTDKFIIDFGTLYKNTILNDTVLLFRLKRIINVHLRNEICLIGKVVMQVYIHNNFPLPAFFYGSREIKLCNFKSKEK